MLKNLTFTASQVYLLAWFRHKNRIRAGIGEDGISWGPKIPCWLFLFFFYATHCSAYWEKQWVKFGTSVRGNFSLSDNLFDKWILWWKKLTVLHELANIANFIPSFQVQSVRVPMKTKETNKLKRVLPEKIQHERRCTNNKYIPQDSHELPPCKPRDFRHHVRQFSSSKSYPEKSLYPPERNCWLNVM